MPTIVIVGAGPGLGLSIGKVFGRNGFAVALVARTQEKLDGLAAELGELGLYGAITAAQQVLPDMIERGSGTLLFTTGASSVDPSVAPPEFGNVAVASAALRAWVLTLHQALADKSVYAAHVPLAVWIGSGGPESQADTIAQRYWDLHTKRDGAEHLYAAV